MNKTTMKKLIALVSAGVMVGAVLTSCSNTTSNSELEESPTETTTVIETTTEDIETTFPEKETRRVFEGLEKDDESNYPYKIASYTTNYKTSETDRTKNLQIAANTLNDLRIPAEEIFSFNQTVGKRTVTAGFRTAKVISNNEFVDGLGGGICQVVTTLFEAVLRTNAEIVERSNHSLEISYAPLGGDAAVQWNSQDFKFKNTTGADLQLRVSCSGGKLTCSVYAKEDIDVGNITINISQSGGTYTLVRYCNGTKNYTCTSRYKTATTTTQATTAQETTTAAPATEETAGP